MRADLYLGLFMCWRDGLLVVLALLVGAGHISPSLAQSSVPEMMPLEEVLIVATRTEMDVLSLPYSVQRLSAEHLDQQLVRTMPEALAGLPGVMVQKTANGQGSPFIRGFTGYRTLALIDGVRYNNSVYRDGPNEYFSLIDAEVLGGIELLSGPASTLYGSDAIGGTLSLQTQSADYHNQAAGEDFLQGRQTLRWSSAESSLISRSELQLGQGENWGLHLGYSWKDFGDVDAAEIGEQPHTGYGEQGYDLRFDGVLSDQWQLTLLHQVLAQDDVWRTHSTIYAVPFAGTETGDDLQRLKDQSRSLTYLKLSGSDLTTWLDEATATFSYQRWDENGDRIKDGGERIKEFFDSRMWGVDLQLTTHFELGSLVYGFDFYRDDVDSGRVDFNADGSVDEVRIQGPIGDDSRMEQWGIYAQWQRSLGERTTMLLGSRYTGVQNTIGRYEDPDAGAAASYEGDWSSFVNSLRLTFAVNDGVNLWGGISESFRAPNIADLSRFGSSRSNETEVAATDLKPEEFLTYELGVKQQGDRYEWSATYYYTEIDQFITSTPTGRVIDSVVEVSKQNSGSGHVQGVELAGGFSFSEQWSMQGNVTWLEGELSSFPEAGSTTMVTEPMSRIMPATLRLALRWEAYDRWAELEAIVADKADALSGADKTDTQRIPPDGTPSYELLNLRGGQRINDQLNVTMVLNNLLDEAYRNHGSGSNEPGRGVTLGIELNF